MVKCKICERTFQQITNSHLKKSHNMTLPGYRVQFPNDPIVDDDIKNKISKHHKGKPKSKKHIEKMRQSVLDGFENGRITHNKGIVGVVKDSLETCEKKRQGRLGKKHTNETKNKIGDAHRGKTISDEQKDLMKENFWKQVNRQGFPRSNTETSDDARKT